MSACVTGPDADALDRMAALAASALERRGDITEPGSNFWASLGFSTGPHSNSARPRRPHGRVRPIHRMFPGRFTGMDAAGPDHLKFRAGIKNVLLEEKTTPQRALALRRLHASHPAEIVEEDVLLNPATGDTYPPDAAARFPGCTPTRIARLIIGRNQAVLDEAMAVCRSDPGQERDRKLGLLLGYPACCVDHYLACGARSNSYLFYRSIFNSHGVFDSRLVGSLEYFPCSYGCDRSIENAEPVWRLYQEGYPSWARALRRVSLTPRLFFHAEFCVLFPRSQFENGRLTYRPPLYAALPADRRCATAYRRHILARLLEGDSLTSDQDALTIYRGDQVLHRFPKATPWINPLLTFR